MTFISSDDDFDLDIEQISDHEKLIQGKRTGSGNIHLEVRVIPRKWWKQLIMFAVIVIGLSALYHRHHTVNPTSVQDKAIGSKISISPPARTTNVNTGTTTTKKTKNRSASD